MKTWKMLVLCGVVVFAAYAASMAVIWSQYEPRDVRVEFPSDFREGLVELVPAVVIKEVSPQALQETTYRTMEVADYELFATLSVSNELFPSVLTTIEVEKEGVSQKIRVRYLGVVYPGMFRAGGYPPRAIIPFRVL